MEMRGFAYIGPCLGKLLPPWLVSRLNFLWDGGQVDAWSPVLLELCAQRGLLCLSLGVTAKSFIRPVAKNIPLAVTGA